MPSAISGASYNPSIISRKAHRHDYGRSQSITEGQGSVDEFQNSKLCHYESDNTFLHSNRVETATRSLHRHIKSQPEGLQQCIAEKRVPYPCRSVKELHEFLPDCEKIPAPSQHLKVTQWMESIDGKEEHDGFNRKMEEKQPSTTQASAKNSPVASSRNSNMKKQTQSQRKGKGKAPATKTYSQGYRLQKIQQDDMENVFQMARTMIEVQKKEEASLKYQK
ncbi:hypothetical protein O181_104873 [Austropuccinia psidii MF-1]|uniref:Uncharacterized protein n=1 Tax=Austropuccinia psidii MF-1 TaxID=1389203 RepID=A0A9Q3PKF7_9BASI|nr:hypothetical protein [Austropuccinia psidii MF-1]